MLWENIVTEMSTLVMLPNSLGCLAYKSHVWHKLFLADYAARLRYCRWFNLFVGDSLKAWTKHFTQMKHGCFNNKKDRCWSSENPYFIHQQSMHFQKLVYSVLFQTQNILDEYRVLRNCHEVYCSVTGT